MKSISSLALSNLFAWRNPQGIENEQQVSYPCGCRATKFLFDTSRQINYIHHIPKVIATELALPILAATALIESIVYTSLTLLSLCLYPITDRPCKFFASLLQSSAFSIPWAVGDFLYYNAVYTNVLTKEENASLYADFITRPNLDGTDICFAPHV
jgi:hypothetical protein